LPGPSFKLFPHSTVFSPLYFFSFSKNKRSSRLKLQITRGKKIEIRLGYLVGGFIKSRIWRRLWEKKRYNIVTICFCVSRKFLKRINFFFKLIFSWYFQIVLMYWCQKYFFKKYIILMHFQIKKHFEKWTTIVIPNRLLI
jgi:hypothetical protein